MKKARSETKETRPKARVRLLAARGCHGLLGAGLIAVSLVPAASGGEAVRSAEASSAAAMPGWTQFRGPGRAGVSAETGLLRAWPEGGPRQLWRQSIGGGFSGVSIAGARFCTLFALGDDEFLGCFRVADGRQVWRRRIGNTFSDEFGDGPRSTPTIDGDVVYGLGARGRLVAVMAATGEPLWEMELTDDYGLVNPQLTLKGFTEPGLQLPNWGYSSSPLVEEELILVDTGAGAGKSIVAFDKQTGKVLWTALSDEIGYLSPIGITVGGQRQLVVVTPTEIFSFLPNGEIHWRQPWERTYAQPLFLPPDRLFVSTSLNERGAQVLAIGNPAARVAVETVWENRGMRNVWSASVFYDGNIYGFDNATFRCLSAATGESRWARRGLGKGSLVAADGLLFIFSDQGSLILVEASSEEYREKGRVQIFEEGRTWTPPSLADGRLYLRGNTDLVCLDLKG